MNDAIEMQISAFVDGELPQNEAELLLRRLCQDRELRQKAAEYLAMGRVIRGERVVAGMSVLRERIAAELDDQGFDDAVVDAAPKAPRFVRPIAGVAIAASVALVALLGLQQMTVEPGTDEPAGAAIAEAADDSYTVPDSEDNQLLDYERRHNASFQFFDTELVAYPVPEEVAAEDEQEPALEDAADEAEVPAETPAP